MNYIIQPLLPQNKHSEIIIDEAEYKEITNARKLAWDILLVKELFSYVVRNLSQLENEIQKIETEAMKDFNIFTEKVRTGSFHLENTHTFNLLVMNLLTTCRAYLELFLYQSNQDKAKYFLLEENNLRNILKTIKNEHHDNNIFCMFFWALRNYSQHHSKPIIGSPYSINSGKLTIGFTVNAEKAFKTLTNKQLNKLNTSDALHDFKTHLEQKSKCFSQQELAKYPKKLNIRPLIKEYILLIKNIHEETNKEFDSNFQDTKSILSQKVQHYCQDESPESGFEIYKQNEENQQLDERFDVCLKLINDWEQIIEKYSDLDLIAN